MIRVQNATRRMPAIVCLLLLCGGCALNQELARVHLEQGDAALARQDLDVALAEFQEAVELNPEFAEGHTKLGLVYKQSGDLQKAAEVLEDAVRLDPFHFLSMFELGEVYRLLDRMTQAIRAYVLACKLDPDDFDSRFRLATCYHRNGDFEQAIEAYETALKIDAGNAYAWSNLGAVFDARGTPYEAIRSYKRSLECDTQQPVVLVNLATVYLNQERWTTARRTLEATLQMAPNLSVAHERLGYCNWREQKLDEAAESYGQAVELNVKNARAHAGYGVVRMTQYLNEPALVAYREEAIESWHRSLELDSDQPKLRSLIEKYRVKTPKPILSLEE